MLDRDQNNDNFVRFFIQGFENAENRVQITVKDRIPFVVFRKSGIRAYAIIINVNECSVFDCYNFSLSLCTNVLPFRLSHHLVS